MTASLLPSDFPYGMEASPLPYRRALVEIRPQFVRPDYGPLFTMYTAQVASRRVAGGGGGARRREAG